MEHKFADVTENWFRDYGVGDPVRAAQEWQDWYRASRAEGAALKKILALATGLTDGAIRHYLNGRPFKLGAATLARLDLLCDSLGFPKHYRRERPDEWIRSSLKDRRIALFAQIEPASVPSLSFHLSVIHTITRSAAAHNFSLSLHETAPKRVAEDLARVVRHYRPSATVLVRLTPDTAGVEVLRQWAIPTVLVHADRLRYPSPPVLGNVVPDQRAIEEPLLIWAKELMPGGAGEVVIVAMRDEASLDHYPCLAGPDTSIRTDRKKIILQALRAYAPVLEEVEDYSFRHAFGIVDRHPDAALFVCLSDEIAIGIKQLLKALGKPAAGHVVGFDDNPIAGKEGISSFSQNLYDTGEAALGVIVAWYLRMANDDAPWPEFKEIEVGVQLVHRD